MAAKKSRYLGVQPFKTSDRQIFFGRDADIENLHDFILLEKLVVLFGKSGYGKSSLLNAGVMPRLLDENQPAIFRYRPIEVRFTDYDAIHSISPQETLKRLLSAIPVDPEADFLASAELDETLWLQFKRRQTAAGGQFVVLFDQFEEFFSYPVEQQESFRRQLAELLYTDIPQSLRAQLEIINESNRRFLTRPMIVKAVFAIRSDRMSQMDSMKDALPGILHKRYELRPLTPSQAREAIVKPACIVGEEFSSPPFEYTESGLKAILQALTSTTNPSKDESTVGVEAFQLQIICEYLESRVREEDVSDIDGNGLIDITEAELPEMNTLYENYYHRKLSELTAGPREKAQQVLEDALLAEDTAVGEFRRKSVDRLDLLQMGLSENLLDNLEKTYLIRRELNTVGGYNYEISHDTLLGPILKSRKARIDARERAAQAKRIWRLGLVALLLLVLTAGAAGLAVWALGQRNEAKWQQKIAEMALSNFRAEQAAKNLLAFERLENDVTEIVSVGGCPAEKLREMLLLAGNHPDSIRMRRTISRLQNRLDENTKLDCK